MSQVFDVNYNLNVQAQTGIDAINRFKRAVGSLTKVTQNLADVERRIRGVSQTMASLTKRTNNISLNVSPAVQSLDKLITKTNAAKRSLQQLQAQARKGVGGSVSGGSTSRQRTQSRPRTAPAVATPRQQPLPRTMSGVPLVRNTNALGYKLFGPTPLPNNGGMAIDMLKGMGIAYGIAGLGSMVSNIVQQSAEYDNIMKTVENILKVHDDKGDFGNRFSSMSQTIRNVGMETKFKVTEVADAAKFLAMAGLGLEEIQQAIRPIADIALIGDTDLGETADMVTNIMTGYGISSKKMRNAVDVMTNTFTMSNTTLAEIAESYKYANLLSLAGVPFEETTAAIGVLGDAGIKGSQAGTTLRMIMNNISNPTKSQARAWAALGINTKDQNGKTRDLLDIFRELKDKGAQLTDVQKLFRITAASGAAALLDRVDKWDKVYTENFLSQGLSSRLADEKKNTLQGLWAQLTSVFTDKGVTAFGGIQGTIRGLMQQSIAWLKTDKVTQLFKQAANTIMEFIRLIIDATKKFYDFFQLFAPLIKTWVKFQLLIWPIVKAVTAFKSVFLGLLGLQKVSYVIFGLGKSIRSLGASMGVMNMAASGTAAGSTAGAIGGGRVMSPFGFATGLPWLAPLSENQLQKAAKGLKNLKKPLPWNSQMTPAIQQHLKQRTIDYYKYNAKEQEIYNRRVRNMQLRAGAAGLGKMGLGAAGAYIGMSQMTKENANGWDMASGGLFAAAGMAAMVGGPVGWIAAAALAIGGLATSFASFQSNLSALSSFVQSFSSSHQLLDGVLLNGSTKTERYLEFVWRKNYDINDLIQRRIELTKELLGIESPNATTTKDVGNEIYSQMYEKFYAADSIWGSYGAAERATQLFNKYGEQYGLKLYYDDNKDGWVYKDADGNIIQFANPDGTSDTNDAVMYGVAAAMEMLHGSYRSKIIDENQHRLAQMLYGRATAADARNWRDTFAAQYGPASWASLTRPDQWNEDTDVAKYWSGEDIAQSYMGAQLLWKSMYQMVEAQNAIADFKTKLEAGQLTENDVVKALRWGDYDILGQTLADYNPNDVYGWFRNMGYIGNGVWQDPSGRETPEVMAQTAAGQMQRLLESIQKLGLEADPSTQALQTYANTLLTLAESFLGQNEAISGAHDGETKVINGQTWRWNASSQQWELLDDNNQPAQISQGLVDLSNNMFNLLNTVQTVNSEWPVLFPTVYNVPGQTGVYYDGSSPYNWGSYTSNGMLWNPLTSTTPTFDWMNWGSSNNGKSGFGLNSFYTRPMNYTTTGVTMTPQQMGNAVKGTTTATPTATNPTGTTTNPRGGGGGGADPSKYRSHYNQGNAAPKQINVTIKNLMAVDKIDLSNPNNVAVINNLKEQLAQALVDVVADTDVMLAGLTT